MAAAVSENPARTRAPDGDALGSLTRGLRAELALLGELRAQLIQQRAALAADDTATLEQVVQQIGRTLLTLGETRRQRAFLVEVVTGAPGASLLAVAEGLPEAAATTVRALCRELHAGAVATGRDLTINQTAIRRAIESGERFLHQLLTVPNSAEPGTRAESGMLFNQRA